MLNIFVRRKDFEMRFFAFVHISRTLSKWPISKISIFSRQFPFKRTQAIYKELASPWPNAEKLHHNFIKKLASAWYCANQSVEAYSYIKTIATAPVYIHCKSIWQCSSYWASQSYSYSISIAYQPVRVLPIWCLIATSTAGTNKLLMNLKDFLVYNA